MKKKILVVDDDIDILEPLSLILESNGYIVENTTKAEQAYEKVSTFKPNLILLDILMSGSDGRTICKKLKQNVSTKDILIILISAHPNARKDSTKCKADDFIAKPFESEELLERVEKILTQQSTSIDQKKNFTI